MSTRSPLENKVGELCVVSYPKYVEVDTSESHPSHFSVGVWLDTSRFTEHIRAAWGTLGGSCQIHPFELRVRCTGDSQYEFVGHECHAIVPASVINFRDKIVREGEHICAKFTVDIPPTLHPPYKGECTFELFGSVTMTTTDATGTQSTIIRTGRTEIDIVSKYAPLFLNPVTPSGPDPWGYADF